MVKVEVTEDFTLGRFNELKNIVRKSKEMPGKLFKGDVFECEEELVNYLSGNNALKRAFVKVIEVLPKHEEEVIPLTNSNELEKLGKDILAHVKYHEEEEKPKVSMKLKLEDVKAIAKELNKVTKSKKSKK